MTVSDKTTSPDQGWRQHFEISQELGGCYAQLGDYQQARAYYQKAAGLEPDDPERYIGAGMISLHQGRLADAEMAFQAALCLDPRSNEACVGYARIAAQQGKFQQAFNLYRQCIDRDCDCITALLEFFHLACRMDSMELTHRYLTMYLEIHPGEISVMCCLAMLHMKHHRYVQAQALIMDALALEPAHVKARNLLDEINRSLAEHHS